MIDLKQIETTISDLEEQLNVISDELVKAGNDIQRVRELGTQYAMLEETLREQLAIWEEAADYEARA
jgi:regulator of replication initiation timing